MRPPRDDIRNDNPTPNSTCCPVCQSMFTPVRRQRYCTPACRQTAWRTRNPAPPPEPPITIATRTTRRTNTVYQCPDCDGRYIGRQWCHDCNKPCTRLGTGGSCPHCDEPVTITDLIG